MRKKSAYKPRPVRVDTMQFVMAGFVPVRDHAELLTDLRLKNHSAMVALTQGKATRADLDVLIAALNMTEALVWIGYGREHRQMISDGLRALRSVGQRGLANGNRFVLTSIEMSQLNGAMDLHNAQLDSVTVQDFDQALSLVRQEIIGKRATPIKETSE